MDRFKGIAAQLSAGTLAVLFFVLFLLNLALKGVGASDDLRSISDPVWWERLLVWLVGIDPLIPLVGAVLFFSWFLFLLTRDAGRGTKALTAVKTSNDKAWEFQGDYQAFRDRIDSRMDDLLAEMVAVREALEKVESRREITSKEIQKENSKILNEYLHNKTNLMLSHVEKRIRDDNNRSFEHYQRELSDMTANFRLSLLDKPKD